MTHIRRTYAYLMTFAGLALLSVAAASLGSLLLDLALPTGATPSAEAVRETVARDAAAVLVGLPVWLLHWAWIGRTARRDESERSSTLRRLFLYTVLVASMLVLAGSVRDMLQSTFDLLLGNTAGTAAVHAVARPIPFALTAAVVWLGHWRTAEADRRLVGETGGSATLRRWYLFGLAFVGLMAMLIGLSGVVEAIWLGLIAQATEPRFGIVSPAATSLIGLGVWMGHWRVLPSRLPESAAAEDGTSVLRSVYLFLTLGVVVAGTLVAASQVLYYVVARLLGVEHPGGASGDLLQAAAEPASVALVYGTAWAYQRATIRAQARAFDEAPQQAGVRRLYTYLVALVSLSVLVVGVAGLLWTLADVVVGSDTTWREQVALFATLAVVGLPVWALHWRATVDSSEARSLARRLYLYVSLSGALLALIGSVVTVLYRLISVALGATFGTSGLLDLTHGLAVATVASTVAVYHWRIIRADSARAASDASPAAKSHVTVRIEAADAESLARALEALRATGVSIRVCS
jgi:Domain of unknown function (DUF5671)